MEFPNIKNSSAAAAAIVGYLLIFFMKIRKFLCKCIQFAEHKYEEHYNFLLENGILFLKSS